MIGGFLGAGKTTAVAALARHLASSGLRVGLITNDQGSDLVDTAMLRSRGFATEEIPGGCFCCRFNSLVEAAERLTENTSPDVFVAEPVGSCTDLVATVTYPLRRIYGDRFVIAPLSVLVDPIRAERILGLAEGKRFSEKVLYIYRKQLEEADLIVISKADLLDRARLAALQERTRAEYPNARVATVSVRTGEGVNEWFSYLAEAEQHERASMEIDYDTYAEGEALLGWLNATVQVSHSSGFDSSAMLRTLCGEIQARLGNAEIAHLKMTLSPDQGLGDVAVVNLVRNDFVPELSIKLDAPVLSGQLVVNARAEASPELLRDALLEAVTTLGERVPGLRAHVDHVEHFRPGRPNPTHRDTALSL